MKKLLFIFVVFLFSCQKREVIAPEDFIQPVMLKVQAVHIDGLVLESQTVLVR